MNGANCTFAHGEGELRNIGVKLKTVLCKHWSSTGSC